MMSKLINAPRALLLGAVSCVGVVGIATVPFAVSATSAFAQEDGGHTGGSGGSGGHDGGDEGGGEEGGGHDGGEGGGKGNGHGGSGGGHGGPVTPPPVVAPVAASGDGAAVVSGAAAVRTASASGQYLRFELGASRFGSSDANWLPPGFPGDPQVFFDLDMDSSAFGGVAIGHNYSSNLRAEVALNVFGNSDFTGPWTYTVPATPGPHASVTGSVKSVALMANGYYAFETSGNVKPFVTAGLGVARNSVGTWSRVNAAATPVTRSFAGDSKTSLAWSVGLGVAVDVGPVMGSAPATLELAWRYFDLGTAQGGSTPVTGGPGGVPVAPLNFDLSTNVVSVGLRIPLN